MTGERAGQAGHTGPSQWFSPNPPAVPSSGRLRRWLVPRGLRTLTDTMRELDPTLQHLAPVQTACNYVALWFRNISSLLSEGDINGTWQRFIIVATPQGPNNEGGPSSAPADGRTVENHLHTNPYPNTAAPGQPTECEAANETYAKGRTVTGNVPGTQRAATEGNP